jgi:phospholipase/lecithinase/hemolysin
VWDLGETYRAAGLGWRQVAFDQQGHLTPLGHRVVAEEIAALLAEPRSR